MYQPFLINEDLLKSFDSYNDDPFFPGLENLNNSSLYNDINNLTENFSETINTGLEQQNTNIVRLNFSSPNYYNRNSYINSSFNPFNRIVSDQQNQSIFVNTDLRNERVDSNNSNNQLIITNDGLKNEEVFPNIQQNQSNVINLIIESPHIIPERKPLFKVVYPKKRGRKEKGEFYDGPNSKFRNDNVIKVILTNVVDHYEEYINIILKLSKNSNIKKIELKKINNTIIKEAPIYYKKIFLDSEFKNLMCGKLNHKYKKFDSKYNKSKIDLILKEGEEEIKDALKKTGWDIIDLYCSKRNDIYHFEKMQKLEDDLDIFENNGEDKDYIITYKNYAFNFKEKIEEINARPKAIKKSVFSRINSFFQ